MKATEKNVKEKPNTMLTDILDDLKGNWWKYLISFVTGAGATLGGMKLMSEHFDEKPLEEDEEDDVEPMEPAAE